MKASVDYEKYFKSKMKEFDVKSPKDFTKAQWDEIDKGWHSKQENNYSEYFKGKMKEFKVKSPKDLSKSQWNKIDKGWKSEKEKANESKGINVMRFSEFVKNKSI